jgi:16S rRNA processing protein RimM
VPQDRILMGVIGRPHGVRGLVRVTSYAEDLAAYGALADAKGRRFVVRPRGAGVAEIAEIVDGAEVKVADHASAERLTNTRLYVERARLPEPEANEFYLADLIGLTAIDAAGALLGSVSAVHDYGAGSSLEIARADAPPLLVPFTRVCVPDVDIAGGRLVAAPPDAVDTRPQQAHPQQGGPEQSLPEPQRTVAAAGRCT